MQSVELTDDRIQLPAPPGGQTVAHVGQLCIDELEDIHPELLLSGIYKAFVIYALPGLPPRSTPAQDSEFPDRLALLREL